MLTHPGSIRREERGLGPLSALCDDGLGFLEGCGEAREPVRMLINSTGISEVIIEIPSKARSRALGFCWMDGWDRRGPNDGPQGSPDGRYGTVPVLSARLSVLLLDRTW